MRIASLRHVGLLFAGLVLLAMLAMAVLAPLLSLQSPYDQDLLSRNVPPFWMEGADPDHWLGTDALGRDYFARLLLGARVSLIIGVAAAVISGVIGTTLGVLAGYFGGKVDTVVSFIITGRLAMPVILVALAVVATVGASLTVVVSVLGLLIWDRYALVMRATTRQIRHAEYVIAARVQGCHFGQILLYEILPNLLTNLVVIATLEIGQAIVLETALSFLGLGVPPPRPSWGRMIAEGKAYILFDPWLVGIPGAMLFLLILAINLFGDGLRDVMAPEGRN